MQNSKFHDSQNVIKEFEEDSFDKEAYPSWGGSKTRKSGSGPKFNYAIIAVFMFLLTVLAIFFTNKFTGNNDFKSIEKRLDDVEMRLKGLEKTLNINSEYTSTGQSEIKSNELPSDKRPEITTGELPSKSEHLVQPGESLSIISQQYGLTVEQLIRLNNLSKDGVIHPGQTLKIRPSRSR